MEQIATKIQNATQEFVSNINVLVTFPLVKHVRTITIAQVCIAIKSNAQQLIINLISNNKWNSLFNLI